MAHRHYVPVWQRVSPHAHIPAGPGAALALCRHHIGTILSEAVVERTGTNFANTDSSLRVILLQMYSSILLNI